MTAHDFAVRLGRRAPLVYRILRPPYVAVMRALGKPTYWEQRSHYRYYREAERLARAYAAEGSSALDVGASDTEVLDRLDWFERRVALDVRYRPPRSGIETVTVDFSEWRPPQRFDLVLCLQVLEHLPDPVPFARKLLDSGETVIVSVPYRWPAEAAPSHAHDPVDERKLDAWFGCAPVEHVVVDDGRERLVAVYRGDRGS